MIRINLLPREYQKRKFSLSLEKNSLYVIVGGVALLLILAAYSLFFQIMPINTLDKSIATARMDADRYGKEIKMVNQLNAQKDLILTRMGTIEELDRDREAWVNLISDLSSRLTDYLWLTKFGKGAGGDKGQQANASSRTVIEGRSFSLNSLATFIVRLRRSPYLSNIDLVSISLEEDKGGSDGSQSYESYHFTVQCDLVIAGTDATQTEGNIPADKLATGSEF
jgi:Tfp pilus assembly protein PilN